ncbi:MAG: hypothetical protein KK926_04955 [Methanomethylovorans sp.]|nr:hypothetical protein [Methanomethylovorans sp.]
MKIVSYLLMYSLLLLLIFSTGCTDGVEKNQFNENLENVTELTLTVVPEKTELEKGELCNVYLTLTNIGNSTLNVVKMEEQVSYNIFFRSLIDNTFAEYTCTLVSRVPMDNEDLVEIRPGQSLYTTFGYNCWILNPDEYMLSAVYHVGSGEMISKPYWIGEVKSNEVLIKVRDTQSNLTASL